jgi:hypothetical protein
VGGGVAGLSAARYLKRHTNNFLLLELEDKPGGNSIGGKNSVSAFPWGAHYLPLPGSNDPELITFLHESEVITGTKNGLPVYNEFYLCHDPKERLFIHHYWQDSIIPHEGVPQKDRDEIHRFLTMMSGYKQLVGRDNRYAFEIPLELSSQDENIIELDRISAHQFLINHHFQSPFLYWYVNYCCADDYGSALEQTSAWAMVHYFASRRGKSANASSDAVLTWPEGNYWLVKALQKKVHTHIRAGMLAYSVSLVNDKIEVLTFDAGKNTSIRVIAEKLILATPQFINKHLLQGVDRSVAYQHFQYSPWMVANLTVDAPLNEGRGEQLCWDNVIYGSKSLGYVNAQHQQLGFHGNQKVITYYKPLAGPDSVASRMQAYSKQFSDWKSEIVTDLKTAHLHIENNIQEMNVWLWGHGMVRPSPGFIWGQTRRSANTPLNKKIFFAHSDVAGISIFEEAFYQGHKSARAVLEI